MCLCVPLTQNHTHLTNAFPLLSFIIATTYFGRIACWHLLGTLALASIHIVLNLYLLVKLDGSTYFADTAPFCLSVLSSVVIICLMGVCVYKRAEVTAYRFARDTEAMVSFRKICFTVLLPLPLFVFSPYVAFQIGSSWTYAHSLSNLRIKESVPVSTTSSFVTAGYEAFTFTDGFMLPQIITQKNYGQRIFSVIPVFDNNCIGVHTPAHASYDTAIESVRDCPVQFWFAGFRTLHASGDGPYDVATLKAFPRHGVVISDHLRNLPQSADVNASVIYKGMASFFCYNYQTLCPYLALLSRFDFDTATAAQAVVDHKLKAQADAPVLINFDARVDAAAFRDDFSLYIGVAVLMVAVDITLLCARLIVEATCPKHAC